VQGGRTRGEEDGRWIGKQGEAQGERKRDEGRRNTGREDEG
jgi:hypothetical protein